MDDKEGEGEDDGDEGEGEEDEDGGEGEEREEGEGEGDQWNTDGFQPSFLTFFSPWGQSFLFGFGFSLVLSLPVFEVSFLSFTPWFSPPFGGAVPSAECSGKRISAPFCSKFICIPCCLNRHYGINTPCSVGKKKNLLLPWLCWELEGARPLCSSE